jgi:hypothetical protein
VEFCIFTYGAKLMKNIVLFLTLGLLVTCFSFYQASYAAGEISLTPIKPMTTPVKKSNVPMVTMMPGLNAPTPPTPPPATALIVVAKVVWVKGNFKAESNQKERVLEKSSLIYLHDTLITGNNSQAQIVFTDSTLMTFRENSKFLVDKYSFDPQVKKGSAGKYIMNLIEGGFRTITGLIAKNNPDDYQVNTPVATIGVRGTDYAAYVRDGQLDVAFYKGMPCVTSGGTTECLDDKTPYASVPKLGAVPVKTAKQPVVFKQKLDIVPAAPPPATKPVSGATSGGTSAGTTSSSTSTSSTTSGTTSESTTTTSTDTTTVGGSDTTAGGTGGGGGGGSTSGGTGSGSDTSSTSGETTSTGTTSSTDTTSSTTNSGSSGSSSSGSGTTGTTTPTATFTAPPTEGGENTGILAPLPPPEFVPQTSAPNTIFTSPSPDTESLEPLPPPSLLPAGTSALTSTDTTSSNVPSSESTTSSSGTSDEGISDATQTNSDGLTVGSGSTQDSSQQDSTVQPNTSEFSVSVPGSPGGTVSNFCITQ